MKDKVREFIEASGFVIPEHLKKILLAMPERIICYDTKLGLMEGCAVPFMSVKLIFVIEGTSIEINSTIKK